jgi:hypothetical protein
MPVPVPAGRLRVDLEHLMPRGAYRSHEQTAAGLDRHVHRDELLTGPGTGIGGGVLGQQHQQCRQSGGVLPDAPRGQHVPGIVDDGHVVVMRGPVDPAVDRHLTLAPPRVPADLSRRTRATP